MTNLLIFLVLVAQIATIIAIRTKRTDFSSEDASVRAMTESVKKAKTRLPKEN